MNGINEDNYDRKDRNNHSEDANDCVKSGVTKDDNKLMMMMLLIAVNMLVIDLKKLNI